MQRHSVDFPEPDGPIDDDHLAMADGEVDVPQHVEVAEPLVHLRQLDERRCVHRDLSFAG